MSRQWLRRLPPVRWAEYGRSPPRVKRADKTISGGQTTVYASWVRKETYGFLNLVPAEPRSKLESAPHSSAQSKTPARPSNVVCHLPGLRRRSTIQKTKKKQKKTVPFQDVKTRGERLPGEDDTVQLQIQQSAPTSSWRSKTYFFPRP